MGHLVLDSVAVLFGVSLLHTAYFVVVPGRLVKACKERRPEWLRRYLEFVAATPTFVNSSKIMVRQFLVAIYFTRGQHAEAVAHCRAILHNLAGVPTRTRAALDADTRRRLADNLEALGQVDEAAEERQRAANDIDAAPAGPLRHMTQGTLLERQSRYEEAYQEHLKALELTPVSNKTARIECLVHLALAAFNAGRPVDCVHCGEEAIALGATGRFLRTAHRMAGVGCGNLGRLEESERHHQRAYEAAVAEKSNAHAAECLGSLASCLRKRGKLAAANEACLKAAALDPKGMRMAFAVQAQIFRDWGRFDEALAAMARNAEGEKLVIPQMQRRVAAARALDSARIETEAGRANDAWPRIQEALTELSGDAKLSVKCDAAASWVLAGRGLADESRRIAEMLQPRLAAFEADPSTQRSVYYDLGMAALARGDYQAGIDCWTRYLVLSPDPVNQPSAYYQRGECHLNLGQHAAARDDFQSADAMNLDTYYSGLARRRLADLRWQSEIRAN